MISNPNRGDNFSISDTELSEATKYHKPLNRAVNKLWVKSIGIDFILYITHTLTPFPIQSNYLWSAQKPAVNRKAYSKRISDRIRNTHLAFREKETEKVMG